MITRGWGLGWVGGWVGGWRGSEGTGSRATGLTSSAGAAAPRCARAGGGAGAGRAGAGEQESPSSPNGPQQVLSRIQNEIKAGNPVKWSSRLAAQFGLRRRAAQEAAAAAAAAPPAASPFQLPELRLPAPPKTM